MFIQWYLIKVENEALVTFACNNPYLNEKSLLINPWYGDGFHQNMYVSRRMAWATSIRDVGYSLSAWYDLFFQHLLSNSKQELSRIQTITLK